MSSVPTTFFLKELLSNPVWLPNGRQAPWEPVGDDLGVLATQDANLIFHLSNLAQRHVGGVVRIDEAKYQDIKKNSTGNVSPRRLEREAISAATPAPSLSQLSPAPAAAPAAVVGNSEPAPLQVPIRARTGKAKPVAP